MYLKECNVYNSKKMVPKWDESILLAIYFQLQDNIGM